MSPQSPFAAVHALALEHQVPVTVHLELTRTCTWACPFCYLTDHRRQHELGLGEWERVLDELRSVGTLFVTLTGGEPLLHPDALAVARAVRARAFALRLFTNGSLVGDHVADEIAALHLLSVELPLHGAVAATHDRAVGLPGAFDTVLAAVDRLIARGVPVVLKTLLTRYNEGELDAVLALAEGRGVPLQVDPVLAPRDDGDPGPLAWRPSRQGLARLMARLAERGRLPAAHHSEGGVTCGLGRTTLAIDPEGEVYPCLQWRHSSLGNVRETRLRELWLGSAARRQAAAAAREANDRLAALGGVLARTPFCPAVAALRTGDPCAVTPDHRLRAELIAAAGRAG